MPTNENTQHIESSSEDIETVMNYARGFVHESSSNVEEDLALIDKVSEFIKRNLK